ncbi:ATP-binding protein [Clostridium sp. PL3]|uniref:histidine kinase n=1 Tax=Clostridium thailandense TaxID=2794346 RepID=A0A949TQS8_9CLOT|nr:ATP-binding protein [Clostridium thailandense]
MLQLLLLTARSDDEVKSRLKIWVIEKNIFMFLNCEEIDLQVCADRRRIEQVITNILSNSIRHTNINGYIQINVIRKAANAYISIENSGEHIPQEDLIRI